MKMKKSLLIVPAMATLLLAAAGSVGGTVAWFSANTQYDATAGQFAVGALDGNLSVHLENIHGTTCDDAQRKITLTEGDLLADASFNMETGDLYTDSGNNNGVVTGFKKLDTLPASGTIADEAKWVAKANYSGSLDMHWAVAWKMSFTYSMPSTGIQQNLYFDDVASGASHNYEGDKTINTYKGFRLAFFPLTSTNATGVARAWAPLTTETDATKLSYVNGTASNATKAYSSQNLILKKTGDVAPAKDDPFSTDTTRVNYLGNFTGAANTDSVLNLACVAWFEGLDANVVSAATKDIVTQLSMYFYVLPNA